MKDFYAVYGPRAQQEASNAFHDLRGYNKIRGMLLVRLAGLPTLQGLIATKLTHESLEAIRAFCRMLGVSSLLLRQDHSPESPRYPRGGYLVPLSGIVEEVQSFLNQGRIVYLFEPASPFDNGFNVSIMFTTEDDAVMEVVGPGFDASDLQRGDLTPHEVLEVYGFRNHAPRTRTILRVSGPNYRESVKYRYLKIARRLVDPTMMSSEPLAGSPDESVSQAGAFLRQHRYMQLPRNENEYRAIPLARSREILDLVHDLPQRMRLLGSPAFPFVVSCSYVFGGSRLVFWDVTFPHQKYAGIVAAGGKAF